MKSVVIIDDDAEMLNMLQRFFQRFLEVKIQTFTNPKHALSYIRDERVDFVLSDIMMPQMNGIELLQTIQIMNEPPKVLMMTAQATLDKVIKSHRYNAFDFIIKPFNFEAFETKVRNKLLA